MTLRRFLLVLLNLWIQQQVGATKYCSYELNGDPKYFVCARNEYCCNIGCCVHLAFQFYQLWYYWLLLIFMFMICSGGSWWYKFCRQHDASASSHYPSMPSLPMERSGRHNFTPEIGTGRRSGSHHQHAGTATNRAFDRRGLPSASNDPHTYHFHRIWKANNNLSMTTPSYYTAVRYHNSEFDRHRQHYECPYYQLYGPPPSYDSVVQVTDSGNQAACVLITTPMAAENTNTSETTIATSVTQSSSLPVSVVTASPIQTPTNCPNYYESSMLPHTKNPSDSQQEIGEVAAALSFSATTSPSTSSSLLLSNLQPSATILAESTSLPSTTESNNPKKSLPRYNHLVHHPTIHSPNGSHPSVIQNILEPTSSVSSRPAISATNLNALSNAALSDRQHYVRNTIVSTVSLPPRSLPLAPSSHPSSSLTFLARLSNGGGAESIDESGTSV